MAVNVGEYKHRIVIEKREQKKNSSGYNDGVTTSEIMKCWARLSDFYSKELYSSFGSKLEGGSNITVRYCKALSNLNDIEFKEKVFIILNKISYKVQHIDFHNNNKVEITFKVVVVK